MHSPRQNEGAGRGSPANMPDRQQHVCCGVQMSDNILEGRSGTQVVKCQHALPALMGLSKV